MLMETPAPAGVNLSLQVRIYIPGILFVFILLLRTILLPFMVLGFSKSMPQLRCVRDNYQQSRIPMSVFSTVYGGEVSN